MLCEMLHPTLMNLPGLAADKHGNLNVLKAKHEEGLRHRYVYLMGLPLSALKGVHLSEMLEWIRWGSETGCMWENTIPELIQLIARWENANPDATEADYGIEKASFRCKWDEFWRRHEAVRRTMEKIQCRCGKIFEWTDIFCPKCDKHHADGKKIIFHPVRGRDQYNLEITGAGGISLAVIAWTSRGLPRNVPQNLLIAPLF